MNYFYFSDSLQYVHKGKYTPQTLYDKSDSSQDLQMFKTNQLDKKFFQKILVYVTRTGQLVALSRKSSSLVLTLVLKIGVPLKFA